jgi:transcriptional regulator with XRE-family HTH domain
MSMDGPAAIGERIKELRLAFGYNVAASFCRATGITTQALNNYERGRARIAIDEAYKVIRLTGASLDWIYRGLEHTLPTMVQEKLFAYRAGQEIKAAGEDLRRGRRVA